MPSHTRRTFLATVGSATVALAGCLSDGSPSGDLGEVDGSWPMDGHGPGHTRRIPAGPADPTTTWATDLDEVRAASTPAVADGRLYVPVDAVSDVARHRYRIHALAAATGEERWQVSLRSEPNGPPAIRGERVVVSARPALERGRIVAFRTRYGDEEWLYDVDTRLTATPTIDGGTVYVPDWSGRVHALSLLDGSVRWSRRVGADASSRTFSGPAALDEGTLYLGSSGGETGLVAVDADTGDERWHRSTDAVTAGPVVAGDLVVVRTRRVVVAFDTAGRRRWAFNVLEDDSQPLALDDAHVYVPARETLVAIDRDGEEAWTYDSPGRRLGPPTVAGDAVLVRSADRLTALSRTDGTELWTAEPSGTGRVVATPEALFLTGDGDRVVALGEG